MADMTTQRDLASFNNVSIDEAAKTIASSLRGEQKTLGRMGVIFPSHLVDAHAKHLTHKWFRWRLPTIDRQRAIVDLIRKYLN